MTHEIILFRLIAQFIKIRKNMENRASSPTLFAAATPNNNPVQLYDADADNPHIVDFLLDCDGVVYSPGTDATVTCPKTFIPYKLINTITQTVTTGTGSYTTTITPCTVRDIHQEWNNITKKSRAPKPNTRWLNAFTPMIYQNLSLATEAKLSFVSSKQDTLIDCFEHNGYPGVTFDRTYYAYLLQLLQSKGALVSHLVPELETQQQSMARALEIYKDINRLIDAAYSDLGLTCYREMDLTIAAADIPRATANIKEPNPASLDRLLYKYCFLGEQAAKEIENIKNLLDKLPQDESYANFITKIKAQNARLQKIIQFNSFTLANGNPKKSEDVTLADYQRREMSEADLQTLRLASTSENKTNQPLQVKAREIVKTTNTKLINCIPNMNKILNVARALTAAGKTHLKAILYQPTMQDKKGQVLDCLNEKSKRNPGKNMVEIFIDDSEDHCSAVASIKREEIPAGITLYVYRYAPEDPTLRDFIQTDYKIVGTKAMSTENTATNTETFEPHLNQAAHEGIVCKVLLSYAAKAEAENNFATSVLDAITSTLLEHPINHENQLTTEEYNKILYQKLIEAAVAYPEEALAERELLDAMASVTRELNFTPLYYPLGAEVARRKTYEFEHALTDSDAVRASVTSDQSTVLTTRPPAVEGHHSSLSPGGSV